MSQNTDASYRFPELPLDPVAPGTALLVSGDSFAGTPDVALELTTGSADHDNGLILLAIDESGPELIRDFERVGGSFDRSRMAVVECGGDERDDANIRSVGSPSDLTGIGIEFTSLYEDLHEHGIRRVRTGVFSLSTLLMYTDDSRAVYRFLHTFASRVRAANGFAACVIDPSATDEQTLSSLAQPFDGRVDVRANDDGETELRVRGLPDQSDDWRPVDR